MAGGPPPGEIDQGHPLIQFIQDVLDIFYAPPDAEVEADPVDGE